MVLLAYGFADASGSGFGLTIEVQGQTHYRIRTWGREESDNSSNWREFENLVEQLSKGSKEG